MPNPFREHVNSLVPPDEHERAVTALQAQLADERARANDAERQYNALVAACVRVAWLALGALVILSCIAWAATWAVG